MCARAGGRRTDRHQRRHRAVAAAAGLVRMGLGPRVGGDQLVLRARGHLVHQRQGDPAPRKPAPIIMIWFEHRQVVGRTGTALLIAPLKSTLKIRDMMTRNKTARLKVQTPSCEKNISSER